MYFSVSSIAEQANYTFFPAKSESEIGYDSILVEKLNEILFIGFFLIIINFIFLIKFVIKLFYNLRRLIRSSRNWVKIISSELWVVSHDSVQKVWIFHYNKYILHPLENVRKILFYAITTYN